MRQNLFYFMLFIFIIACKGQSTTLTEKGNILTNCIGSLQQFAKVADIVDNDAESYWAYTYADSLLGIVNVEGENYDKDLLKIYSSYTYIFYGMSYSNSIRQISKGSDYSLKELSNTLFRYEENTIVSKYKLSKGELASIYGMINFYKVTRMPNYTEMYDIYNNDSIIMEKIYTQYQENEAYKIITLQNKKLYYKTIINLIIDLYLINHPNIENRILKKYFDNLTQKGKTLDNIPNDYNTLSQLNEKEFYKYWVLSSHIQKDLLQLLIAEIKELRKVKELKK